MAAWGERDPQVAAACRLSAQGGVPLADVLEAIYEVECEREETAARLDAAMAGPKASARVLMLLPLLGMLLAAGVEPRAVGVLFGTPLGWLVMAVGGGLMWAGHNWTGALFASALRETVEP